MIAIQKLLMLLTLLCLLLDVSDSTSADSGSGSLMRPPGGFMFGDMPARRVLEEDNWHPMKIHVDYTGLASMEASKKAYIKSIIFEI